MLKQHVCLAIFEEQSFLGCDRELTMTLMIFCTGLALLSADLLVAAVCLTAFLLGLFILRLMAQADLRIRHIYIRQLRYRPYYTAQAKLKRPPYRKYG